MKFKAFVMTCIASVSVTACPQYSKTIEPLSEVADPSEWGDLLIGKWKAIEFSMKDVRKEDLEPDILLDFIEFAPGGAYTMTVLSSDGDETYDSKYVFLSDRIRVTDKTSAFGYVDMKILGINSDYLVVALEGDIKSPLTMKFSRE